MAAPRRDLTEQEQSIRARGHEVFSPDPVGFAQVRPFRDYLQETPAAPLPGFIRVILWALAILVALLFTGSLWKLQRGPVRPPSRGATSNARQNFVNDSPALQFAHHFQPMSPAVRKRV
jgi:hypothetical protein